jgi:response regulator RpfG family c-di-GMP phosphodiesterase
MKNTLIITTNNDFSTRFNTKLSATFTTKVLIAADASTAIDELRDKTKVFRVVIIDTEKGIKCASEIDHAVYGDYNYFIITVGRPVKIFSKHKHFNSLEDLDKIIIVITSEVEEFNDMETKDYLPINFNLIKTLQHSPSELFIKLSETKFIKRFHKDEVIEPEDVTSLEEKMQFLWIRRSDKNVYSTAIYQKIKQKYEVIEQKEASPDNLLERQSLSFEFVRNFAKDLGVGEEVIELSEKFVQTHIENVAKNHELLDYLKRLTAQPLSLRFKVTQFTIAIASNICHFTETPNLEENIRKISFAALFHDITIEDDEDLVIRSDKELKKKSYDLSKVTKIKFHAKRASELLMKHTSAPYDSLKIVTEHHGSRQGVGFPEPIDQRLLSLSVIFIISEEFATGLLTRPDPEKMVPKILEIIAKKYTSPATAKYVKALKELSQFSLNFKAGP